MLGEIASEPHLRSRRGLLSLRPRLRRALSVPAPVALSYTLDKSYTLETTHETVVIRLVLWMLGRIGNRYAVDSVVAKTAHPDFRVRREAIRTLNRLEAWNHLRRIAGEHPDPRTRSIAQPSTPRDYEDRLAAFVSSTEPRSPSRRRPGLFVAAEAEIGSGRPPKSMWQIRLVLRRIRRLVRRPTRRRMSRATGRCLALLRQRNEKLER